MKKEYDVITANLKDYGNVKILILERFSSYLSFSESAIWSMTIPQSQGQVDKNN